MRAFDLAGRLLLLFTTIFIGGQIVRFLLTKLIGG